MNKSENNGFVQIKNVSKTYHTPAGDFMALDQINLSIKEGEFVSVVGKSGSGKSTLINMITGIDHPSSGTVIINGNDIQGMNESKMAIWRGKNLGIVFQFFQLLPMLTILENTMLPMDFCEQYLFEERETKAVNLLDQLGLKKLAGQSPLEISGGHQQCAAIARALANDPPILLADEPTGNLDSKTAELVFGIFEDLVKRKKTIIMVTHDRLLAKRADRVLILSDGWLVCEDLSDTFPEANDLTLAKMDQAKIEINKKAGELITPEEFESYWFAIIKKGVLFEQADGIRRLFKPKAQYGQGDLIIPDSKLRKMVVQEGCSFLLFPKPGKIGLIPSEIISVNEKLQYHRKNGKRNI